MNTIIAAFTNWKTTLVGAAVAVGIAYQNGGFANLHGQQLWLAIASIAFGAIAKDATRTGAPQ